MTDNYLKYRRLQGGKVEFVFFDSGDRASRTTAWETVCKCARPPPAEHAAVFQPDGCSPDGMPFVGDGLDPIDVRTRVIGWAPEPRHSTPAAPS